MNNIDKWIILINTNRYHANNGAAVGVLTQATIPQKIAANIERIPVIY